MVLRNLEAVGVTEETSPEAVSGLMSSAEFLGSKRLFDGDDGLQAGAKPTPRLSTVPFGEWMSVEVW